MIFLFKRDPVRSTVILASIAAIIVFYLLCQLFIGEYGIMTLYRKKRDLAHLVERYERNNAELDVYQKKIKSLDSNNLDLDLLEEEMRKRMIFTKKDEILVIMSEEERR